MGSFDVDDGGPGGAAAAAVADFVVDGATEASGGAELLELGLPGWARGARGRTD